jgi:hypothetical protein
LHQDFGKTCPQRHIEHQACYPEQKSDTCRQIIFNVQVGKVLLHIEYHQLAQNVEAQGCAASVSFARIVGQPVENVDKTYCQS